MPPWHAPFPALPSLPLCPPASACTMRGNLRCSAPSLPPLSALAPWPCPAPCLLALPRPHVPPFPGPLVPDSRCFCPRPPFTLPAYSARSNTRGTPPTPPSPCRSQAPWFRPHRPAACGPLLPPYLPLPPLPFSLSTLTFIHYAGHFVGKSHSCRRHAPGPSLPALPFPLSSLRRTFRRTPCRHVARTSQARTWPSLYNSTQDTAPMGVDRLAAARRGAPPCPVPPRTAGGSLGCGAPLCFCPTLAPSCRRGTPSSLPCLLCPSALRPARAQCGAIRVAALPLCPLSLPWPLGPVLPPVCSPSLVLSCPPSHVPWSLALGVSVPVLPLPSRHTLRGAIREAPLPLPLHLTAPRRPGSVRTGPQPAALFSRPTSPSLPCPFPSLHSAGHYAGHFVGKSHACRRHAPGPSLPALPFPLSSLHRILRRTLCRHVARMSQARTWPLSAASSGRLAPRCDRPPLPQPPQEPLPRAATPYAAGGAALVGPGCPPASLSLYPPRRLVAGGDPSQISARHRKK